MRNLLYIVMALIATACGFSASSPAELDEARRLMLTDPSAALDRLNAVDVSEFRDSATMADWALLYSEAMVVNRIPAPSDTIVNIAVDYYGQHGLTAEHQKASRLKALLRSADNDDADRLATAIYLQKEKEFFLYKERAERRMLTFAAVTLLIIAAAVIAWMRQRMRLQALHNEALMAEASGLKSRVDAGRGDICRLKSKLHGMLDTRFVLIDSLCQTYYESQGTKSERKAIIDKVKSEIESVRTDYFARMEQAVNDCRDNLLVKVRNSCPALRQEDYQLLVYLACGLSTRTISLLLDQSVEAVYKRKSRLKSRLKESAAADCTDVMAVF